MEIYLKHEDFEKLLTSGYKSKLEPMSFKSDEEYEHAFYKDATSYRLWCSFTGIKLNMGFVYSMPYLDIQLPIIDKYWQDLAEFVNVQMTRYKPTITILPLKECPLLLNEAWYNKDFHAIEAKAEPNGVKDLLNRSFQILDSCLFPAVEKYLDLREIDNFVNSEIKYRDNVQAFLGSEGTVFKRLVIAKLVGNPIYNEMRETYRNGYDWYYSKAKEPGSEFWGNYPDVFEELFKRLEKVNPLASPILL